MLTILSAILGFIGPFIPELIKLVRQKQDNAQELAILKLQAEVDKDEHLYRMEELNSPANIQEMHILHQPQESFGVQMLDATKDWSKLITLPVFYLFAFLDFISGLVRPGITYAMIGFYLTYKWALFQVVKVDYATWQQVMAVIWNDNDLGVLYLVLGYWFGGRVVKATFGGSAGTAKSGGG